MDYYLAIKKNEILSEAKYRTGEYHVTQTVRPIGRKFHMFCPYLETKTKLKQRSGD